MSCLPEAIFDLLGAGQQKGKRPASYTHLLSADVDLYSIILVSIYGDLIEQFTPPYFLDNLVIIKNHPNKDGFL